MDLNSLANQLAAGHAIAALVFKVPELAIDEKQAQQLALAIKDVLAYHKVAIDPKKLAYVKLIGVAGMVYTPKLIQIAMRQKKQREEKRKQEALGIKLPEAPQQPTPVSVFNPPQAPRGTIVF